MKTIEFTITVTPPLVDTVDIGGSVFGGLPHTGGPIVIPTTTEDRVRAAKVGHRGDIGVFSFAVDEAKLPSTCQDIAARTLSQPSKNIFVQGIKENAVIPLGGISTQQLADQIFSIVTKTFNVKGTWSYQSFLLLPTDAEFAAKPGTSVTSRKWALGQLVVLSETEGKFQGELIFAPSVKLDVEGRILPSTNSLPAVFEAIGEGFDGPTEGAIYKIIGWISTSSDGKDQLDICGSVLAVRGSDSNPEKELGGMPVGTMGSFVLTRA